MKNPLATSNVSITILKKNPGLGLFQLYSLNEVVKYKLILFYQKGWNQVDWPELLC